MFRRTMLCALRREFPLHSNWVGFSVESSDNCRSGFLPTACDKRYQRGFIHIPSQSPRAPWRAGCRHGRRRDDRLRHRARWGCRSRWLDSARRRPRAARSRMILDAETRADDWFRDRIFDACVLGTGPAGITLARKLARHGLSVGLFEAGGFDLSPDSQDLYKGITTGQP